MTFDILHDGRKILQATVDELDDWMSRGNETRVRNFGHDLYCYAPTSYPHKIEDHQIENPDNFISLSVTGTGCSLNCAHCEGRLLKGMEPALTPETLLERCREVKHQGGEGVLISGGSDSRGHVVLDRFGDAISKITQEIGLKVVVHTGLVDEATARMLGEAKIDAAMLDIIGDVHVSEDVYKIPDGPSKMNNSMRILREMGIPIVPHLLVGLNYGKLTGELEALQMISEHTPEAVVIIALNPIRRTQMGDVEPPTPENIGRVITTARLGMENIPLLLGCARPLGQHKIDTDKFAIRSGVNGVAYISQDGVDYARHLGFVPIFRDVCCSLAYQMIG
ncbi:MAG: radical SAM protein [Candidatus Thorarchaeota archaeon]